MSFQETVVEAKMIEEYKGGRKDVSYYVQKIVLGIVVVSILAILSLFVLRLSFYSVHGNSMSPFLKNGDSIVLKQHDEPKKGDLVVFTHPTYWNNYQNIKTKLIKRIGAVPGDFLEFKDGVMYSNGKVLFDTKKHGYECTKGEEGYNHRLTVKEIFVMGDNHNESLDSMRVFCDGNWGEMFVLKVFMKDIGTVYKKIPATDKNQ